VILKANDRITGSIWAAPTRFDPIFATYQPFIFEPSILSRFFG